MKELKFKTSKGEFLVVDGKINLETWNYPEPLKFISKLSEITEEQASEIVDCPFELEVVEYAILVYKDYEDSENTYPSSIDSLYSLLFSKGIHLYENPLNIGTSIEDYDKYKEAEQKTFYNPYIFKLND